MTWQVDVELEDQSGNVVIDGDQCDITMETVDDVLRVIVTAHEPHAVAQHSLLLVIRHKSEQGALLSRHAATVSTERHSSGPYDIFGQEALIQMTQVDNTALLDAWVTYTVPFPRKWVRLHAYIPLSAHLA